MAKAKLRDVSESILIDESKITEESRCEIEKAVLKFSQTRKLSSAILEASVFKKVYFLGTLVPTLLHLALTKEEASIYSEFIAKLQASGKVPASTIVQYEKFKEDQLLKKQANEIGDDISAVKVLLLDSLASIVKCASSAASNVQACLDSELKRLEGRWKKLDALLKGNDELHTDVRLEISVGILNQFCKCATVSGIDSIKRSTLLVDLTRLNIQHSTWHKPMFDVLSNLLTKEHHNLQAYHRTGLAKFVCLLDSNIDRLEVNLGFQVLVVDRMLKEMCHFVDSCFLLRWICDYFLFGVNMFPGVLVLDGVSGRVGGLFSISRTMIVYFQLLQERIQFKMDHHIDSTICDSKKDSEEVLQQAGLVASSGELKMVIDQNKASMTEWLEFQLKHPEKLLHHYRLLFLQGMLKRSSASNRSKIVEIVHALICYSVDADSDSYNCLLLTLKDLITDPVDDNEDELTILGHVIRAVMKDETGLRVKRAFSILNYLPSHLLFSDRADIHQVSEQGRDLALQFINLLSGSSDDQPFVFEVAFYIVQTMLSVWKLPESNNMKDLLCFLKESPSVVLSLLVFWPELVHKYPALAMINTLGECHQAAESGHLNGFEFNEVVTATIFGRYLAIYWKEHNTEAAHISHKRRTDFQSAAASLKEEVLISLCDCLLRMIAGQKGSTACVKEAYIFLKELTTHVPGILQKLGSADHYLLI